MVSSHLMHSLCVRAYSKTEQKFRKKKTNKSIIDPKTVYLSRNGIPKKKNTKKPNRNEMKMKNSKPNHKPIGTQQIFFCSHIHTITHTHSGTHSVVKNKANTMKKQDKNVNYIWNCIRVGVLATTMVMFQRKRNAKKTDRRQIREVL